MDFLSGINSSNLISLKDIGAEYQNIIKKIVDQIPVNVRTVAGLSKWLTISHSNSQRILYILTCASPLEVILHMPSIQGIQYFLLAIKSKSLTNDHSDDLNVLNQKFGNLLLELNTSHNQIKKNIRQYLEFSNEPIGKAQLALKQSLLSSNSRIADASIESVIGINCSVVNKKNPEFLSEVVIANRNGMKFGPRSSYFMQPFVGNEKNYLLETPELLTDLHDNDFENRSTGQFLYQKYTSSKVSSCFAGLSDSGNKLVYDFKNIDSDNLIDICLGHFDRESERNPLQTNSGQINSGPTIHGIECRMPTKRLTLISLMDRELALNSIAIAGNYMTNFSAQEQSKNPEEVWSDRFSNEIVINMFDPSQAAAIESEINYPVQELINSAAKLNGRTPDELIGYYITVEYPLWFTTYRMYFEYSNSLTTTDL
ncbi:hypothetical protein [Colwellia psychrerythraea]|uniref:Uncharacterized protein n=1 Tax=Colwellia psychrerythraea TaxID=28229 RepID=A0A099KWW2_COLPS|nr:hypothetical protein [Colwellia psychrerythraea]KGJ95076.1 hypothetical protein GAB14E_1858 [Colwellia psychrerythraea]